MIRKNWLTTMMILATASALTTGGIALASSSPSKHRASVASASPTAVTDSIAAFRAAPLTNASDVAIENSLKREFDSGSAEGEPVASADFADAHPAPISGTASSAWIAPSGGDVCTYIPDPVNGWGGGCYPLSIVEAGEAWSILGGGSSDMGSNVIVAVVVADGKPAPQVVAPDGTATTLSVSGNVAAALVPSDDTLKVGVKTINLQATVQPKKVRWIH